MADNDPAVDSAEIDLHAVQSLKAFADACDRLRVGRSYADLRKTARPRPLPAATLSDLLNAKGTPTRNTVITFLIACGLDDATVWQPWLAAWERVATAHQPCPAGAVRARLGRPRLLGVHTAIQVPHTTEELPPYVPRDLDADLRTALTAAAAEGGFVLLVGGSSVGKTRALYEAIRADLPEWWLLHPADAAAAAAHAEAPTPRTVIWLDELQRYLNHPTGLPAGSLRQLITAGTVVVATLWPDEYSMRTIRRSAGQPDPYANDRDLLRLAHTIRVPDTFSPAERRRGETLAPTDQRIRIALDATDAGFTQVLAAGPALIQHWEQATDCYGKAVITAALDARRVGAHHPATRDFLRAAAPAYLTPAQQATAPPDWLDRALAYATMPLDGTASALSPVAAEMGCVSGYNTADYLHQRALDTRRTTDLPDQVWHALVDHHHPDDIGRIIDGTYRYRRAIEAYDLYRHAIQAGERVSLLTVEDLLAMLFEYGHTDEAVTILRDLVINEKGYAYALVSALGRQGRVDEAITMVRHFATTDRKLARGLLDMLAPYHRVDGLVEEIAAGSATSRSVRRRRSARTG